MVTKKYLQERQQGSSPNFFKDSERCSNVNSDHCELEERL